MVYYQSDFYPTRSRNYSSAPSPSVSSYSTTTPSRYVSRVPSSPNHRVQEYSYSSQSTTSSTNGGRPQTQSRVSERKYETGPGGVNYSTERTTSSGGGPGGYSYSSTSTGGPSGTRHFSYRV